MNEKVYVLCILGYFLWTFLDLRHKYWFNPFYHSKQAQNELNIVTFCCVYIHASVSSGKNLKIPNKIRQNLVNFWQFKNPTSLNSISGQFSNEIFNAELEHWNIQSGIGTLPGLLQYSWYICFVRSFAVLLSIPDSPFKWSKQYLFRRIEKCRQKWFMKPSYRTIHQNKSTLRWKRDLLTWTNYEPTSISLNRIHHTQNKQTTSYCYVRFYLKCVFTDKWTNNDGYGNVFRPNK